MAKLVPRFGDEVRDPAEADMRAALAQLAIEDDEHVGCGLEDADGWCVGVHGRPGNLAVSFENVETDDPPRHMDPVSETTVLALWSALARGDLDFVRAQPWQPGYARTATR